jgi:CBS domain-containing protein
MVDAHIHRVLVVLDGDRPCGIITSTDILAAIAQEAKRPAPAAPKKPRRQQRVRHRA